MSGSTRRSLPRSTSPPTAAPGRLIAGHREHVAGPAARAVDERRPAPRAPVVVRSSRSSSCPSRPPTGTGRASRSPRLVPPTDVTHGLESGKPAETRPTIAPVVAVVARGEVDADALARPPAGRPRSGPGSRRARRTPRAGPSEFETCWRGGGRRRSSAPGRGRGVVRGADVDDLGARGDGVGPLDVERLLDVPALGLGRILREPLRAGRDDLAVVEAGRAVVVEPVAVVEVEAAREVGDVVADRRREERAGDRDRLAAAVEAGGAQAVDAVRRVDLGGRVAADQPRQRRPGRVRVRERRRGALAPVARAGPDGRAGGRRGRGRVDVRGSRASAPRRGP